MGACGRVCEQGVGACGRVWGHRKYVVGGQAYGMDWDIWQGWGHVVGCRGRVWGHVARVVAGCGGKWQGLGYVVGGQAYGMDGTCGRGGGIWQGVGACGRV